MTEHPTIAPTNRGRVFVAVPTTAIALGAVLLASGCARYTKGERPEAERVTRLASQDARPAFHPGGRSLLFVSDRAGYRQIWLRPWPQGEARLITAEPYTHGRPSWAPDGERFVVSRADSTERRSDLVVVSPETGAKSVLVGGDPGEALLEPAWSPQDGAIAFLRLGGRTASLEIASPEGGAPRRLWSGREEARPRDPAWSPDGEWLVFTRATDGQDDLWALPIAGGEPHRLTTSPSNEREAAIHPRGGWIAFVSDSTHDSEVWLTRLALPAEGEGTRLELRPAGDELTWRPVTRGYDERFYPAWSPDGRTLVWGERSAWHVVTQALEGESSPDTVAISRFGDTDPSWSPEGERIAFVSHRSGDDEIFAVAAAGELATGPGRNLTGDPAADRDPDWHEQTWRIAFVSERSGAPDVWAMGPDGSEAVNLTGDAHRDAEPRWSPDGLRIAFVSDRYGSDDLFALDVVSRRVRRLTDDPGDERAPAWTRDGRFVLFVSARDGRPSLHRVAATGGRWVRLTEDTEPGSHDGHPAVSPAGDRVVFTRARGGDRDLWLLDLASGQATPFTQNRVGGEDRADWSPDGTRLAYQLGGNEDLFRAETRNLLAR